MNQKEQIKNQIISDISYLDIAGYLKEEIGKTLGYFHFYKLRNIYKNIDFLKDYLYFLDYKNTQQMFDLVDSDEEQMPVFAHDIYYYLSKRGLDIVGEKKIKNKIRKNDFLLTRIMLGIKGFLLLTMDEFCNATPVRLSINKILWNRETINTKKEYDAKLFSCNVD